MTRKRVTGNAWGKTHCLKLSHVFRALLLQSPRIKRNYLKAVSSTEKAVSKTKSKSSHKGDKTVLLQGMVPKLIFSNFIFFFPTRLHLISQKNILKIFSQKNKSVNGGRGERDKDRQIHHTTKNPTKPSEKSLIKLPPGM